MKTDFLNFIQELEKYQNDDTIEFRLRFQKKFLKYREQKCSVIKTDLQKLIKSYRESQTDILIHNQINR